MYEVVQLVVVEEGPGNVSPKTQVWGAVKGQHTEAHPLQVFYSSEQPHAWEQGSRNAANGAFPVQGYKPPQCRVCVSEIVGW